MVGGLRGWAPRIGEPRAERGRAPTRRVVQLPPQRHELLDQQRCSRQSDPSQGPRRGVPESLPPPTPAQRTRPQDPGEVRGVECREHGRCPWRGEWEGTSIDPHTLIAVVVAVGPSPLYPPSRATRRASAVQHVAVPNSSRADGPTITAYLYR